MKIGSMAYRICVVRPMSNYISSCMVCGVSMRLPDANARLRLLVLVLVISRDQPPGRLTRISVSQVRFGGCDVSEQLLGKLPTYLASS